jgi:hypothetical protein
MPHRFCSLLIFLWSVSLSSTAWSHSGGIDEFGCHHDRKHGGYHCHHGPFAGQTFKSRAEMVRLLKEMPSRKDKAPRPHSAIPPSSKPEKETKTCIRENVTKKVVCGDTIMQ